MKRALLLITLALPGPAMAGSDWKTQPQPPAMAPGFAMAQADAARADFTGWWKSAGDPLLAALIDDALTRNLDVHMAVARIEEARAAKGLSKAQLLPEVDFGANAARERYSSAQLYPGQPNTTTLLGADLGASWEIDLFGRLRRGVQAAAADYRASQQDEHAARVALIGEVTRRYLAVRGQDQRIGIVQSSARSQTRTAELTRHLFDAGAVPIADVNRAVSEAAETEAQEPSRRNERQIQVDALAILLARPPAEIESMLGAPTGQQPQLTMPDGAGVPADLLRNRPDVRAAEDRVLAAYARLGVAEAELRPRLNFQGSVGMLATGFTGIGLAGTFAWLAGVAINQPVFDAGRRHREVDIHRAQAREAMVAYQSTVLHAVSDVEDALAATSTSGQRVASLDRSAEQARHASDQILRAWKAGESPFLDVLDVQRRQLAVEDALASARTDSAQSRIRLVIALGG